MKRGGADRYRKEFDKSLILQESRLRHAVRTLDVSKRKPFHIFEAMYQPLEEWLLRASVMRGFRPKESTIKLLVQSFDFGHGLGVAVSVDALPDEELAKSHEAYQLFLCDLVDHERRERLQAEQQIERMKRLVRWFGFRYCRFCNRWIFLLHFCPYRRHFDDE